LGKRIGCENCGCEKLDPVGAQRPRQALHLHDLYSPLKGGFKGPRDPFIPIGIGLVELPEGCRLVSALTVNDPKVLKVGMDMRLKIETL